MNVRISGAPVVAFATILLLAPLDVTAMPLAWQRLEVLKVEDSCAGPVTVRYARDLDVAINVRRVPIPDAGMEVVQVMTVRPKAGAAPLSIDYFEGGSCDPGFSVYRSERARAAQQDGTSVPGLTLVIPGDGFLYATGHTNNYFDQTKKFAVTGSGIVEVPQPLYYAGIDTTTETPIQLLASAGAGPVVSAVGANEPVTLVACREDEWCLVKDRLGLLGWIRLEYVAEAKSQLKGIFFAGD